jgi:hypothetical protein
MGQSVEVDGERYDASYYAAQALKAALRPGAPKDLEVEEAVGFYLLADLIQMVRDFHDAYLTKK